MKTTLLTNIFNEEYLLPFWLQHHKDMFDDIIIVDYRSTDKSVEICRSICPNCKIITTRNQYFDAREIDIEFMDIESTIEGIKIVLNTTEFLFCEKPIKEIFSGHTEPMSYDIKVNTPYSSNNYIVHNNHELFSNLLNDDIVFHQDRFIRHLHNHVHGNYGLGRHETYNPCVGTNELHIIWLGFYPMNDNLLQRKLQIQQNISQHDKDTGHGFQHLFSKDKILSINAEKTKEGIALENLNPSLYNLLKSKYSSSTA